MRILIIVPNEKLNGTAKTFLTWIKTLNLLKHDVFLYTNKGNLADWTENYCVEQFFYTSARLEPSLTRYIEIVKIVKKFKIEVIWGVGTKSSLLGAFIALIENRKYLCILNITRENIWPSNPDWKYPNIGHIVTVSEQFRKLLIDECKIPEQLCHFVPAQFDLEELKPVFPSTGLRKEKLTISLFRRFDYQRTLGILSFLKFVEDNKDALKHCSFNLYGGGDNEVQVHNWVNGLRETGVDITNYGFIKDVHNEMVRSDIVIGSERVAIEALLCGRPVCIIGDAGIVNFVTEHNLNFFIADNFSGLGNLDHFLIPAETLSLFVSYEKLLALCNMRKIHDEIAKIYDAKVGIEKLILISERSNQISSKMVKALRILLAVFFLFVTQIRIAFNQRVHTK